MCASLNLSADFSEWACPYQLVNLTCTPPSTIQVTQADFGQLQSCGGCCPPENDDCTQDVANEDANKWQEIQQCSNRTQCSVETPPHFFSAGTCRSPYNAHYMIVYYDCSAGEQLLVRASLTSLTLKSCT